MSDSEPPKKWRPQSSPIAVAFRGEPARFKPYFQVRVEDLTQGRRAFGSCILCRRFAPIHPYYINFQFGRPRHPSSFIVDLAKRLRCTACGNDIENVIIVEAAPGEPAVPRR